MESVEVMGFHGINNSIIRGTSGGHTTSKGSRIPRRRRTTQVVQRTPLLERIENSREKVELKSTKDRVFIVGGGPSVNNTDLSKLAGENTITVNCAVFDVPNPTVFITKDYTFLTKAASILRTSRRRRPEVVNRWKSARRVFVACFSDGDLQEKNGVITDVRYNLVYDLSSVDEVIRTDKRVGIGRTINSFYAGGDSGFSALQYAIVKGYREIYLIGYDMVVHGGHHYHDWYPRENTKFQRTLDKYLRMYEKVFPKIHKWEDIKVVSCSAISKLNEFIPYVDPRKVL